MLFVAVSAALVAAAIALRQPDESSRPSGVVRAPRLDRGSTVPAGGVLAQLNRRRAEVRAAARRFLDAFLRYEVGDLSAPVRRRLRAAATRPFAKRLLRRPPRRPAAGRFPPRATLRRVDVSFVSPRATRAVVSGAALRGGLSEEFSFVLARRGGRWLASGPGE
jgi:Ni/Co efflux regulator RcnB